MQNENSTLDLIGDVSLNIEDVGKITRQSPRAIRTALCRGTFPLKPFKLGNRLRWRASDVRAWLAAAGGDQASSSTAGL